MTTTTARRRDRRSEQSKKVRTTSATRTLNSRPILKLMPISILTLLLTAPTTRTETELLRKRLGGTHHFTTAHCPRADDSVEVVNRLVLKCMRAMLSDLKLVISQWPCLLPLIQAALNNAPSDLLRGKSPIAAFTALPAQTPISSIIDATTHSIVSTEVVYEKQKEHNAQVGVALEHIHRDLDQVAAKKRKQARDRRSLKSSIEMTNVREGDFVLVAQVFSRINKLAIQWKGPKRVVKVLSDHIFEVQHLTPPYKINTHHASRLRFYADANRDLTEGLIAQALHAEGGHFVSRFVKCHTGPEFHVWEVVVEWIGLDPLKASWEPATFILEDVPDLLKAFAQQYPDDDKRSVHVERSDEAQIVHKKRK